MAPKGGGGKGRIRESKIAEERGSKEWASLSPSFGFLCPVRSRAGS